jgi:hypothetical protein
MRRLGGALCAVISLCVAGCGATSLSTQELRSQATRLCTAARHQTDRIAAPSSPAGAGPFLSRGIVALSPELSGLRQLQPAHDLAQVYSTAVSSFSQKLDALHQAAHAVAGGGDPVSAIKTLQQRLTPLEAQEDGAWRALEIPACLNR